MLNQSGLPTASKPGSVNYSESAQLRFTRRGVRSVGMSSRFFGNEETPMIEEWKEFSTLRKIFYIAGVVSLIGLVVMILCGVEQHWRYSWKEKIF
jgi:hypothetical protein